MYCEKSIPPEELIYRVGMGRRKIVKRIKKNFKNKREKDKTERRYRDEHPKKQVIRES